jgi:hypothetical protein
MGLISCIRALRLLAVVSFFFKGSSARPVIKAPSFAGTWTVHSKFGTPVLSTQLVVHPATSLPSGALRRSNSALLPRSAPRFATSDGDFNISARDMSMVPLYGDLINTGGYYAGIYIGGHLLQVMVDTGSGMLLVPSTTCKTCPEGANTFDFQNSLFSRGSQIRCDSSTCGANTCSSENCASCSRRNACCATSDSSLCAFFLSYGDGSAASGWLERDYMAWGERSFPTLFGVIEKASPKFEVHPVDGILGLGYPALTCTPTCIEPVIDAMARNLTMKRIFQICMTVDSGRIVLGDFDSALGKTNPVWVPMELNHPPDYYNVRLIGELLVNGKEMIFPQFEVGIIDSGTTLLILSSTAFSILADYMSKTFCDIPGLCGPTSWFQSAGCTMINDTTLDKLPTLTFQLQGYNIELGARDYMIRVTNTSQSAYWCLGIMGSDLPIGVDVIFGITIMRKYIIVYDIEQSQLGFAESLGTCGLGKTIV